MVIGENIAEFRYSATGQTNLKCLDIMEIKSTLILPPYFYKLLQFPRRALARIQRTLDLQAHTGLVGATDLPCTKNSLPPLRDEALSYSLVIGGNHIPPTLTSESLTPVSPSPEPENVTCCTFEAEDSLILGKPDDS
jgi:hypothetical protein